MNYSFILLLARQRSGTSALGSIMNKHPDVVYPGEPFHIGHKNKTTSFFHYKEKRVKEDSTFLFPDHDQELFEGFVKTLNKQFGGKTFLDVKYNQTHYVNGVSYIPTQTPWLVRYAFQNQCPIIHLTRKNQLKVFVSELRAKKTGIWHAKTHIELEDDLVEVNTSHLLTHIRSSEDVMHMFSSWMNGRAQTFTIDYSEVFSPDGFLSDMAVQGIGGVTGLENLSSLKSDFVKTASDDLSNAISNYQEVVDTLSETPYAWMLED